MVSPLETGELKNYRFFRRFLTKAPDVALLPGQSMLSRQHDVSSGVQADG
jgi:hypothetical protein